MEQIKSSLLEKAEQYVREYLKSDKLLEGLIYHDLQHTEEVVKYAEEIGRGSGLADDEMEVLLLSAWFHDAGYQENGKDHEERGATLAESFLKKEEFSEDKIQEVKKAILATKMPQSPTTKIGEILCDADLAHLGQKGFGKRNEVFREEMKKVNGAKFSDAEWYAYNLDFMHKHSYFTDYAQENFLKRKLKNIAKMEKEQKSLDKESDAMLKNMMGVDQDELKKMKKKLEKAEGRPERGIETMFRTTSRNHVDFSSMADSKANIMISVNSIIITIIIGVLMRKLDNNAHLIIPTFILMVVSLSSIVFSILATRPNITSGIFSKEDIEKKKANLLFFGNFHKMNIKDFEWGMKEMINDSEYLYGSMIRDIYYLGAVLGTKYRFLRISYTIFMFGLIVASIAFMIASLMGGPDVPSPSDTGIDSIF